VSLGTIILIIVILLALFGLAIYNRLVRGRIKVREAWSSVEVQLQRRYSLIPNLVETVKGYAAHERETLDSVTAARAALQNATTPAAASEANNQLTGALKSLFAVAEAYPDLKANANFMQLQHDLADTEDKISYARTYYNATVRDYNTSVETMPNALLAGAFGFGPAEFFQGSEESQAEVEVKF
jgi:LemA protein